MIDVIIGAIHLGIAFDINGPLNYGTCNSDIGIDVCTIKDWGMARRYGDVDIREMELANGARAAYQFCDDIFLRPR